MHQVIENVALNHPDITVTEFIRVKWITLAEAKEMFPSPRPLRKCICCGALEGAIEHD
jgi:hypothetical protein